MTALREFIKVKKYEINYKLLNIFRNDENEDYFK